VAGRHDGRRAARPQDRGQRVRRLPAAERDPGGASASWQPRSIIIATYALCGFANFSSIAIQIGGLGGIAPSRRSDLARLGLRAMVAVHSRRS
jgi:hypothetical protein